MSARDDTALAGEIETAVEAVVGIVNIFPSGSTLANAVDTGARLLGLRDSDASLVRLRRTAEMLDITLSVGVYAQHGATDTAQRAHDAIRAVLDKRGQGEASIHLTVVHIDETAPPDDASSA